MRRLIALLTVTLLLSACGPRVSNPTFEAYCPPLEEYTDQFNTELADEVESLPEGANRIPDALADYAQLRDIIRACNEARAN